ncbi:holo-ACP synthase [Haloarcula sp. CGMCC 1.2071]|uniref:holo-ACP synthase n=1 Tax=Haloarcula sp. CGMCC 1.2071 TaxID=3111454 RepID=UPI00300EFFF3
MAQPMLLSGVDTIAIDALERLLDRYPKQFKSYAFSRAEQTYCDRKQYPPQHYAGRWAVKEAFLKGIGDPELSSKLQSIEVTRSEGRPSLSLSGTPATRWREVLSTHGVDSDSTATSISLSHDHESGVAVGLFVAIGLPR